MHRTRRRIGLTLFLAGMLGTAPALAETWYVDGDASAPAEKVCSGDGLTVCETAEDCPEGDTCDLVETASWCSASPSLQDAIDAAGLNDTILVAEGTYSPDPAGLADPRAATFLLPLANVTMTGGYAGCGAVDPDEWDPLIYETILSGDLEGNDDPKGEPGPGGTCCSSHSGPGCDDEACEAMVCAAWPSCCGSSWNPRCAEIAAVLCCALCGDNVTPCENAYHVVTAPSQVMSSVVLTGFTITGGNGNRRTLPHGLGGGFYTDGGGPTLINCTVRNNAAYKGGGAAYLKDSTVKALDCVVRDNTCFSDGGGMYLNEGGPTVKNCLITGNTSTMSFGGGVYSFNSRPGLYNCTVSDNSSNSAGGGLYFFYGLPEIRDCVLWGNISNYGSLEGAQLALNGVALPSVNYCCIQGCDMLPDGFCEAPATNIGNDPALHHPRFVPGPMGCYYLAQTAAGEPEDSACVDEGSGLAASIALYATFTLADRTTRSDEGYDGGTVDMGYHYPETGFDWILGDYDYDGRVSLADYTELAACLTGPEPTEMPACCRIFDYELNGGVDLFDYAEFQATFTGE